MSSATSAFDLPRLNRAGAMRPARESFKQRRFVTQSHSLGAPIASPGSLAIAAAVVVGLYLIARRLID